MQPPHTVHIHTHLQTNTCTLTSPTRDTRRCRKKKKNVHANTINTHHKDTRCTFSVYPTPTFPPTGGHTLRYTLPHPQTDSHTSHIHSRIPHIYTTHTTHSHRHTLQHTRTSKGDTTLPSPVQLAFESKPDPPQDYSAEGAAAFFFFPPPTAPSLPCTVKGSLLACFLLPGQSQV